MQKTVVFILLVFLFFSAHAQFRVEGIVKDKNSGKTLKQVHIRLDSSSHGTISDKNGIFSVQIPDNKQHTLHFSHIGYKQTSIICHSETRHLNVEMEATRIQPETVVVTASRYPQLSWNIPQRVISIPEEKITASPINSIDDILLLTAGMNVNRPQGIYSNSVRVGMRAFSGQDQSRMLVMLDGLPLNLTDGGSVNWNMINPLEVARLEIVKGAGSAIYGSNSMGGTINIISKTADKTLQGMLKMSYGSFNTFSTSLFLNGISNKNQALYWSMLANYRTSDGYISQAEADQTEYTVPSFLDEKGSGMKLGYRFSKNENIELHLKYYDDKRGMGEKIFQEDGSCSQHDTFLSKISYKKKRENKSFSSSIYYILQNYKKESESFYSSYKNYFVKSKRKDMGISLQSNREISSNHKIVLGLDARHGQVNASDIYRTSNDLINNNASMDIVGIYCQDELSVAKNRIVILSGIRFDMALFHSASFTVENPSSFNAFLLEYQNENIGNSSWSRISPRLSILYKFKERSRIFAAYSSGFRPPILEDMCRSGKIRGGFKILNPDLKPEHSDNFEVGADVLFGNKLQISPSVFHTIGRNFLYYVNTGDSIHLGYMKPILMSRNISKVSITGFELDTRLKLNNFLDIYANYTWNHAFIKDYNIQNSEGINLEGNYLSGVPEHMANLAVYFTSKWGNFSTTLSYHGKEWINDLNSPEKKYNLPAKFEDYILLDMKVSKIFWKKLSLSIDLKNITNKSYFSARGSVNPGRFIMAGLSYSFSSQK